MEGEAWRFRINGSVGLPQCDPDPSHCCTPAEGAFPLQVVPFATYYGYLVDDPWSSWVQDS
eukprot:gene6605-3875_t